MSNFYTDYPQQRILKLPKREGKKSTTAKERSVYKGVEQEWGKVATGSPDFINYINSFN